MGPGRGREGMARRGAGPDARGQLCEWPEDSAVPPSGEPGGGTDPTTGSVPPPRPCPGPGHTWTLTDAREKVAGAQS